TQEPEPSGCSVGGSGWTRRRSAKQHRQVEVKGEGLSYFMVAPNRPVVECSRQLCAIPHTTLRRNLALQMQHEIVTDSDEEDWPRWSVSLILYGPDPADIVSQELGVSPSRSWRYPEDFLWDGGEGPTYVWELDSRLS